MHGSVRHRQRSRVRAFPVKDELVLVAPRRLEDTLGDEVDNRALTLNESGRAIWELCDGSHTVDDMVRALEKKFPVERELLTRQIGEALAAMSEAGFVDRIQKSAKTGTGTTFVIGIEDKPYMWWQTAIFLESFREKLPAGWQTLVVVCNDGEPLSEDLANILAHYDTEFAVGANHVNTRNFDTGQDGHEGYSALNRVEALSVAGAYVDDGDMVCLLDSDIFLYGNLNTEIMPQTCAAPRNWHIEQELFFSSVEKNKGKGVDLRKLLEAVGCDGDLAPGAVNVFVSGKVAKDRKFIADCYRFAHALFLLGRIAGVELVWMAELPCFALAMTANRISYDLLEQKELLVSDCSEETIPEGTLYHYYSDPGDFGRTAFHGSKWYKHVYMFENFLRTDFQHYAADAKTDHERYFFQLAQRAVERLYV